MLYALAWTPFVVAGWCLSVLFDVFVLGRRAAPSDEYDSVGRRALDVYLQRESESTTVGFLDALAAWISTAIDGDRARLGNALSLLSVFPHADVTPVRRSAI